MSKKVLIIANNSDGLYRFRNELIKELSKDKEIVISTPFDKFVSELRDLGCKLVETPIDRRSINPIKDFRLLSRLIRLIRRENPDLIITYTIKPNIYGSIAALLAKKRYAVNITGLGTAFENPGLVRTIVVNLYRFALKRASVVFFENSADRETFLLYKCCRRDVTHVLNGAGVNTQKFGYIPYPNNVIFKFLFVGRVMKEKGIEELFNAMRRLYSEVPCCLDVVGPFEENYEELLKECENEGWLVYHGFQNDVRPFIGACDCFVLPSYHEGMANTNLESASMGRPIITTSIPGCKEAVINSKSGYLCEPRNPESLYLCMKKIMGQSRNERIAMGLLGRSHMESVFDKHIVVNETINCLYK